MEPLKTTRQARAPLQRESQRFRLVLREPKLTRMGRLRCWLRLIPQAPEPQHWRYGFAAVCTAGAFLLRLLLDPVLREHSPLLLFALAVAVSAIRGFGPGMFSTGLGAIGALFFFPPMGTFLYIERDYWPTAAFQVAVFLTIGVILSFLGGQLRRLRWRGLELLQERSEILESITDGFGALDKDGRIIYLNERAAEDAACSSDAATGRSVWEARPDWRIPAIESRFLKALESRVPVSFEHRFETPGKWWEFHLHPAANGGLTVYFRDITERKRIETDLRETLSQRDTALKQVQLLRGLLPICAACKKIRDKDGHWQPLESYISARSQAQFSHGLCPDCAQRYMAELT